MVLYMLCPRGRKLSSDWPQKGIILSQMEKVRCGVVRSRESVTRRVMRHSEYVQTSSKLCFVPVSLLNQFRPGKSKRHTDWSDGHSLV